MQSGQRVTEGYRGWERSESSRDVAATAPLCGGKDDADCHFHRVWRLRITLTTNSFTVKKQRLECQISKTKPKVRGAHWSRGDGISPSTRDEQAS